MPSPKMVTFTWAATLLVLASVAVPAQISDLPRVRYENGAGQLLVHGQPLVLFGGELGNSSAGTAAQADTILPALEHMHLNMVLVPVAWEQIEPREGSFDFSILDHWIDVARQQNLHLGLLWFGSWKNAFSEYAPAWVKSDTARFPRARAVDGSPLEILSTFGTETQHCDARAFAALMKHLREKDAAEQTVLLIQVENEVGYLGSGRDRSIEANRQFEQPVPQTLLQKLSDKAVALSPELAAHFNPQGHTWREVFGDAADEVFMASRYATYIDGVAEAGKKQYSLPMYMNAQLPSPSERAGEYPSGGPHPYYLAAYRAIASHIDFFSPDIYWPDFEHWVQRYQIPGNPIFVPEARLDTAPYNALYAYGSGRAFGFCPFGIDSVHASKDDEQPPLIAQTYAALQSLGTMLPQAQAANRTRGLVLHATSPRPAQTIALGGYLFQAALSHTWPSNALASNDGALLLLQSAPDEFYAVGSGLSVNITRDPDVDAKVAGIASIEEVERSGDTWQTIARLNGDQSDQGRRFMLDPHRFRIYRLRLYAATR